MKRSHAISTNAIRGQACAERLLLSVLTATLLCFGNVVEAQEMLGSEEGVC